MNKYEITGADTYTVINKSILEDSNHKLLTCLYQPIIGFEATSLYLNLWSSLDKMEILSSVFVHSHIFNMMGIASHKFVDAREALEAIGLLKSYFKKGTINTYIYEMYAPLEAAEFLNHPVLAMALYTKVGKKEYKRITEMFKVPEIKLNEYTDISTAFTDLYRIIPSDLKQVDNFKMKKRIKLAMTNDFDFDFLKSSLPSNMNVEKIFNEKNKELIKNIAYVYNLDELKMKEVLRNSVDELGVLNKVEFRKNARSYYQLETGTLPRLMNKKQPLDKVKENKTGNKRDKMIYAFETTTPYNFLKHRNNNGNPSKRDLKIVEDLVIEMKLNPGVVNVLLDYVFRINNNKLTQNFVLTIAGQWQRMKIETVDDAMRLAEKEYKAYNKKAIRKSVNEKTPEWFDKKIEKESLENEDKNKLDTMLKDFK